MLVLSSGAYSRPQFAEKLDISVHTFDKTLRHLKEIAGPEFASTLHNSYYESTDPMLLFLFRAKSLKESESQRIAILMLDEYDLACQQLQTVETEIITVLNRIPFAKSMLAVKGISAISLAGILGKAGDLSGFVHGNALLRHAGLNLAEAGSGKWTGQMKISKRGRSRLRRLIFMMTMCLVMNNPEFQAHAFMLSSSSTASLLLSFCIFDKGEILRISEDS